MLNVFLTVGHDVRGGEPLSREAIIRAAQVAVGQYDCSVFDGIGFYTHKNGTKITEASTRLEFYAVSANEDFLRKQIAIMADLLGQESIAAKIEPLNTELIERINRVA